MIKIEGNKNALYQWDLDRRVILTNIKAGIRVQFADERLLKADDCLCTISYEENGYIYSNVPNVLLQNSGTIKVYIYVEEGDGGYTEYHSEILVIRRPKPATYIYTETELYTSEAAAKRIMAEAQARGDFREAMFEVDKLPTENIKFDSFYRTPDGIYYFDPTWDSRRNERWTKRSHS